MSFLGMFLDKRLINHLVLYTIVVDVVLASILGRFHDERIVLPVALLCLMNLVVIAAVYRFWLVPIFAWNDKVFVVYGISPFKKETVAWDQLEYVCFKEMEEKKGRLREFLVLHYVLAGGIHKTNMVPMYMVGFADRLKDEFLVFLKRKGIKPQCQPGL